jgi:transposase-like protein
MALGMRVRKAAEWQARFDRFRQGAASVARFCRDEGVSVTSFYLWRRKLRPRGSLSKARIQEDSVAPPPQGSFVPVRVIGGLNTDRQMTAQLPGGTRLEIPLGDPQVLQVAITALVRADAECAGGGAC